MIKPLQGLLKTSFEINDNFPNNQLCLTSPVELELKQSFNNAKNCLYDRHISMLTEYLNGKIIKYESPNENQYLVITGKCYNDTIIKEGIYFDVRTDKRDLIQNLAMGDEDVSQRNQTHVIDK